LMARRKRDTMNINMEPFGGFFPWVQLLIEAKGSVGRFHSALPRKTNGN
jgi:hypothetical protein